MAAGKKKKVDPETLRRVFGDGVSHLSRDECGDRAAEKSSQQAWKRWLSEQKPPHYDY